MTQTNLTTADKLEALCQYEARAVESFWEPHVFAYRIARMEAKMKQHGITPEQFLEYKNDNHGTSHA